MLFLYFPAPFHTITNFISPQKSYRRSHSGVPWQSGEMKSQGISLTKSQIYGERGRMAALKALRGAWKWCQLWMLSAEGVTTCFAWILSFLDEGLTVKGFLFIAFWVRSVEVCNIIVITDNYCYHFWNQCFLRFFLNLIYIRINNVLERSTKRS